ncbi:methionine ABC transporter substrate-binding lipoprotein MetQ [Utexia brackfieldae]|uniref:methionine ABC transporter substrate-binding lipoprotein MetQ n=1 Tax=Utexia brackfieldae TaxID=3074108 RepID=UPI00370D077E
MIFKKIAIIITLASAFLLAACDHSKTDTAKIKVGVIMGPEEAIAEVAKQQAKALYNLDVELVSFNDYVVPNQALSDGLIDVNAFQHKPFLDQQEQARGYQLAIVGNTFVYPIASYSKKLQPITENSQPGEGAVVTSPRGDKYLIPAGATIAIPNDPTNLGRSLLLLQHQGLIKVDPDKGLFPRTLDITSNPYNYKIIELEAPMLPRALDDEQITLAVINNAFAGKANLTPNKDGIFVEDKESPYVNIIVSREDNKNSENVVNFVKAYQTEAVAKKANEIFNDGAVQGW